MHELTLPCTCCGTLLTFGEQSILECPACGTPNARYRSTGASLELLQRAVNQRLACDFHNAEASYQQVLMQTPEEHEALWGRLLCRYGVEYVEDPATKRQRPTVHSVQRKPMQEQADFLDACRYAPAEIAEQYRRDAAYIDAAQAEIRRLAATCPPWDVFLCHKTTRIGSNEKTEDFHRAYQLYHFLKEQGVRAFFAPQCLTDVAGANYEAGIYNALTTAKVMFVICSDEAHLTSPWVRSEWTRFLDMADEDPGKRLIPLLYNGFDSAVIPQFRFRSLQGLDMNHLTASQTVLMLVKGTRPKPAAQSSILLDGLGKLRAKLPAFKLTEAAGQIPLQDIRNAAENIGKAAISGVSSGLNAVGSMGRAARSSVSSGLSSVKDSVTSAAARLQRTPSAAALIEPPEEDEIIPAGAVCLELPGPNPKQKKPPELVLHTGAPKDLPVAWHCCYLISDTTPGTYTLKKRFRLSRVLAAVLLAALAFYGCIELAYGIYLLLPESFPAAQLNDTAATVIGLGAGLIIYLFLLRCIWKKLLRRHLYSFPVAPGTRCRIIWQERGWRRRTLTHEKLEL